jgi:hypothetical protein
MSTERYVVTLELARDPLKRTPEVRLRLLLKIAARSLGLKCVDIDAHGHHRGYAMSGSSPGQDGRGRALGPPGGADVQAPAGTAGPVGTEF